MEDRHTTGGRAHPYSQYRLEYETKFRALADAELTTAFNSGTCIDAWNFARAALADALFAEFERRGFDWSVIGNEQVRSLKYCVLLVDKTFYRLTSFEYSFVQSLLERYFQSQRCIHQKSLVELVAFDDSTILYRLTGNTEIMRISVKDVVLKVR